MNGRLLLLLLLSCVAAGPVVVAGADGRAEPRATWGDWVVAGDDADAGPSILLRRITPKSVFVAPTFTGCSEGYRQDSLGRCVKLVKVNPQSQWNFFLERLNSMYAPSSTSKNPQKETGPFHINLPLASEGSQEESMVKKRLPPTVVEVKTRLPPAVVEVRTTQSPTTTTMTTTKTTTTPLPQTSTWPTTTTTTMPNESTTVEAPLSTMVEPAEVTDTEKDMTSTTPEARRDETTEGLEDIAVMLGDQPYEEVANTPKNKNISQLQEKPFLIIVTNPTVTRSDITSTYLPTEGEIDYETSTTEATMEGNTKYTTETSPKPDESFDESRAVTETPVRPSVTVRPGCEDQTAFEDCEPFETEVISGDSSPSSLPDLPLLDPSSQVRFPSESFVPVRKTQSFVRFPDVASPHEDRPAVWWPSWQIRQYPGIQGWPEYSDQIHGSTDRVIQRKYPYGTTWSNSMAWQRRFLQRD